MSDLAYRGIDTTKSSEPGVLSQFWADTSGAITVDWTVVTGAVVGLAAVVSVFVYSGSEAKTDQVSEMLVAASEFDNSFEGSGTSSDGPSGPRYPTSDSNGDDPENPANGGSDNPGSGSSSSAEASDPGTSGGSTDSGTEGTPTADSDQGGTQTSTDGSQQTASTSDGSTGGSSGSSASGGGSGGGSSSTGAAPALDPNCYNKNGNIKKRCRT